MIEQTMTYHIPRCRILPLPNSQVSFLIDNEERTRWHFGAEYERPFFFPMNGPAGESLTRIGHPGAPNHDHHRSVWFAHHKVAGINFWGNNTTARIRQTEWLCYEEGDDEARMVVKLHWTDGHDPKELIQQELIAIVRPGDKKETFLEIQTTFVPVAESLEFEKTNFGFFAVRMATNIAEVFGGGLLTNSKREIHENNIFGKPASYMDYSGPVAKDVTEGITYFDHPANPGFPNRWHVRKDGWMGCSPCMNEAITTTKAKPLTLRFLLHLHAGAFNKNRADEVSKSFANHVGYELSKRPKKHTSWGVQLKTK